MPDKIQFKKPRYRTENINVLTPSSHRWSLYCKVSYYDILYTCFNYYWSLQFIKKIMDIDCNRTNVLNTYECCVHSTNPFPIYRPYCLQIYRVCNMLGNSSSTRIFPYLNFRIWKAISHKVNGNIQLIRYIMILKFQ